MLRKIVGTLGTNLGIMLIQVIVLLMTTQLLGQEGRGEISLFVLNVSILVTISSLFGGVSLVYMTPKVGTEKLILPSYVWGVISISVTSSILILFDLINTDLFIHLILIGFIRVGYTINSYLILGKNNVKAFNLLNFIEAILLLTVFFYLIFIKKDVNYISYIYATYISVGVPFFISCFILKSKIEVKTNVLKPIIKEVFRYGFVIQSGTLAATITNRFSFFLLDKFLSVASVGFFSTGLTVGEKIQIVPKSLSSVQYAHISNSNERDATSISKLFMRISFLATFLILFIVLILPSEFYELIIGKDFSGIKELLVYLSPGILIFSVNGILTHYFSGIGNFAINTKAAFITMVLTIVICSILIPIYGIYGAVISTVSSYAVSTLFLLYQFNKEEKLRLKDIVFSMKDVRKLKELVKK